MILADTDIIVDVERGHPPALEWMNALPAVPYISGFTALEMLQGCQNMDELRRVRTFLSIFPLVWPTDEDLYRALTEYTPLRLSHGLSVFDMLIATTAVGYGLTFCTFNTRHFSAVPNLMIEEPYTR